MPLIKDETLSEDYAVFTEGDVPGEGLVTVTLARYLAEYAALAQRNAPTGVRLSPEDDPRELMPYLAHLALIEIDFPKYTDGRGYSQAQLLRRRMRFDGEVRAVGHVLRDQIGFMARSGIDSFQTVRAGLDDVLAAIDEFSDVYQPAADTAMSVFARRHGG